MGARQRTRAVRLDLIPWINCFSFALLVVGLALKGCFWSVLRDDSLWLVMEFFDLMVGTSNRNAFYCDLGQFVIYSPVSLMIV